MSELRGLSTGEALSLADDSILSPQYGDECFHSINLTDSVNTPEKDSKQLEKNTTTKRGNGECVAIANALQLEAARRCAVPILFNFVARAKFEVAQPIRCRFRAFLLLIRYVTL